MTETYSQIAQVDNLLADTTSGLSPALQDFFKGVQQGIGPIPLSSVYERTDILLDDLPTFTRESVEATISADDLEEARSIVERLAATTNG